MVTLILVILTSSFTVSKVVVRCDHSPAKKQLEELFSHPDSDFLETLDSANIIFANYGYFDATVVTADSTIEINCSTRSMIDSIRLTGDSTFSFSIRESYSETLLTSLIDRELNKLYRQGFYYASINVVEFEKIENSINVSLNLQKGPKLIVSHTRLNGLKRTDPKYLRKFLIPSKEKFINSDLLSQAESRAEQISFVKFNRPLEIVPLPGLTSASLVYNFDEKQLINFEGGVGYFGGDKKKLLYSIRLAATNIFGRGKSVSIHSEKKEEFRSNLDIEYRQPLFLLENRSEISIHLSTRDYRDEFYQFAINSSLSIEINNQYRSSLMLGIKSVKPADTSSDFIAYSTGFSLLRKMKGNMLNPINGWSTKWEIEYLYRKSSEEAFNDFKNEISFKFYKSIYRKFMSALFFNYMGLQTKLVNPPLSELYLIGGEGTLRGYQNEQFPTEKALLATIETRIRFNSAYFFLFIDNGYLFLPEYDENADNSDQKLYRTGHGGGIALLSSSKLLKFTFSWGEMTSFDAPNVTMTFSSGF